LPIFHSSLAFSYSALCQYFMSLILLLYHLLGWEYWESYGLGFQPPWSI
jgi:hypothetical protein